MSGDDDRHRRAAELTSEGDRVIRTDRKGALQVMLILLFVLLLILGLALLTAERSASTDEDGAWRADVGFDDAQAMRALVGLLRQPIDADLDGDGATEVVTIADAIAADRSSIDNSIIAAVTAGLPQEYAWSFRITYPDRKLERSHDIISPDGSLSWSDLLLNTQGTGLLPGASTTIVDEGQRIDAASLVWKPCSPWDYTCDQPERGEGTGVADIKLPGATVTLLLGGKFGYPAPDAEASP